MINLKKSNRVAIYVMGLTWGYAMAKAYDRKARRDKRGKTTDLPKLIGMTWEEWYRLQYNLGEKVAEIVECVLSTGKLNQEINESIRKSKDLQKKAADFVEQIKDADGVFQIYTTQDGCECVYLHCDPKLCERRVEIGCTGCTFDEIPDECIASDDDDDSCRECPRFQRNSRGCDGCDHQQIPPSKKEEEDDDPWI